MQILYYIIFPPLLGNFISHPYWNKAFPPKGKFIWKGNKIKKRLETTLLAFDHKNVATIGQSSFKIEFIFLNFNIEYRLESLHGDQRRIQATKQRVCFTANQPSSLHHS